MTQPVVLVVGSLHYDIMVEADHLPVRDETAIGQRWFPKFGGKGGNQAVATARAGASVRMVGAIGDDDFGPFLRHHLREAGVDHGHVLTVPGTGSGMSVAIVDKAGDYAATIVSGANLALDPLALAAPAIWDGVRVLVLQNEVPETVNLAAATVARDRQVLTILNAAPSRATSPSLDALVNVLIVNAVEAGMMGCAPIHDLPDAVAAARHLSDRFSAVVVTAGAHGLAGCAKGTAPFSIPAEPVTVVSTHGAGDAFVGTLAHGLAQGLPLELACHAASVAAARHVSRVS